MYPSWIVIDRMHKWVARTYCIPKHVTYEKFPNINFYKENHWNYCIGTRDFYLFDWQKNT